MGTTQSERARSKGQAGKVRAHRKKMGTQPKASRAPSLTLNGDPSEDEFQQSVAHYFAVIFPPEGDVAWSHFPAGGYELTKAARGRLYRIGLTRGWPDMLLVHPNGTLWIELKTPKGVVKDDQKRRHNQLRTLGHAVVVCRTLGDVTAALKTYRVPFRRHSIGGQTHGDRQTESRSPAQLEESARRAAP